MSAPDPDTPSRLVVGSQPVNRRTRPVLPAGAQPPSAAVQQRQQQLRARVELGRPLADGATPAVPRAPLPLAARVQAGVGVVSLSGALFVGQPVAVGVLVLVGSVSLGWVARSLWRRPAGGVAGALAPAVPAQDLAALDALLARAAPALPDEAASSVQALKQDLARLHHRETVARLAMADQAYLHQCVVRYLPDTLEAYLAIPAARRGEALAPGEPTAHAALVQQLAALRDGVQRRLAPAEADAAEALLRQQRFLDQKSRE
ncbi:hypothetical protein [Roseateles sp. BYS87W]|uniref:5-bromo-4-chloroindolyl phosphate hydrolysis protein n=1 Tax=Pelomonas baiyunensis TaxID=3299026 RepID=A0ABW7H1Z5_9BURK